MRDIGPDVAGLSDKERAVLELWLRQKARRAPRGQIGPGQRHADHAPLSFAQERLWTTCQLDPHSAAYNVFGGVRLEGRLEVGALAQALAETVKRHEALRTTFRLAEGEPRQFIAATATPPLELADLRSLAEADRAREVGRFAEREARHAFDLTRGPLFRAKLLRLAPEEHVLLLTMHHIISDGWSMKVLVNEVKALYEAFARGGPSPLSPLPIQYADYAIWQRDRLREEVLADHLAYWKKRLSGAPTRLQLPTAHPPAAARSFRGARQSLRLSARLTAALKQLSQREQATLFMTLLAGFQALLARYTGQTDICVGTPVANRNRVELEGLIGFFVNMLVLRADLSPALTFRALLAQVRDTTLEALHHQDLPFEKLVEALRPARVYGHTPLFQAAFALNEGPVGPSLLHGVVSSPLEVDGIDNAKFDLSLFVEEDEEGLRASIVYSTDLFEAEMIERMLRHFRTLLEGVAADPTRRIADLPLLSGVERRRLLLELNRTATAYPAAGALAHELFERQAAATPGAVAALCGEETVTYGALNMQAEALARRLRVLGVGPEVAVGVYLRRSVELVVALLGVWKAGGAYVPLDPSYPTERLTFMLHDARAPVLLTQHGLAAGLPAGVVRTLYLDDAGGAEDDTPSAPAPAAQPDNLAYIMYTSGSTGQPKGVMITHRGLVNYLCWCGQAYATDAGRGVLVHSPIGFDLTVTSLLAPLMVGQKITLLAEEQEIRALETALHASDDLSFLKVTPSHLEILSRLLSPAEAATKTKLLIIGGEALYGEHLAFWRTHAPDTRIINEYGPTEAVVGCAIYEVAAGRVGSGAVPIGGPVANMQLYVLDQNRHPVPVGVTGELYIGGIALARGYHARPGLTAERFVPHPFSAEPGARLYRTGDLARHRLDGHIEYLGRNDQQVKVRGVRVELGEIEAVLGQHPAVREAAVVVREDVPGDRRLVAYVVADGAAPAGADALLDFLKRRLHAHMLPDEIVPLPALPLTPNGKIDRAALPAPTRERRSGAEAFAPPRDPLELQLARMCEDLLNRRPLGVTEDFFEAGGNSLLAARLLACLAEQFTAQVSLSLFLLKPTVEHLATLLRQQGQALPWTPLVPIQPQGAKPPFFCVHPFSGNVLIFYELARLLGVEQPFYGLQAPHPADLGEQYTSIEEMAASYLEAVAEVEPEGPYLLGGFSFGSVVAFEMAQQLTARGRRVALLALVDGTSPLIMQGGAEQSDVAMLAGVARDLARTSGIALPLPHEQLSRLEPEAALTYILDRLKGVNLVGPEIGLPWIRRLLRGSQQRARAVRAYKPAVYTGAITLFRSSEVEAEGAKAWRELGVDVRDEARGWGALSAQPVEVHRISGHHATLLQAPHVRQLAARLGACLDRAQPIVRHG